MQEDVKRRRYNVYNRRDKSLNLRVSEVEDDMIRKKAELLNMSIVDFIIHCCDKRRVVGYNKKNFQRNNKDGKEVFQVADEDRKEYFEVEDNDSKEISEIENMNSREDF